jgi:NADH-quinone oxidoreductase subunit B
MYGVAADWTGIERRDARTLPSLSSLDDRFAREVAFAPLPRHGTHRARLNNRQEADVGVEEKLPSGVLLTTVEGVAGYMRKASFWPATFGLACCAIEMMTSGGPKYDLARFGMEVFRASPRQADLMIVAGRVSQKMAPVLRQIYDQMPDPKWVLAMGVCASSGGMFNNYAIVQGVDHVVPVDMYLPGCPPRPEMLIDAILKLHDQVKTAKLGSNRRHQIEELETAALNAPPTSDMRGLMR